MVDNVPAGPTRLCNTPSVPVPSDNVPRGRRDQARSEEAPERHATSPHATRARTTRTHPAEALARYGRQTQTRARPSCRQPSCRRRNWSQRGRCKGLRAGSRVSLALGGRLSPRLLDAARRRIEPSCPSTPQPLLRRGRRTGSRARKSPTVFRRPWSSPGQAQRSAPSSRIIGVVRIYSPTRRRSVHNRPIASPAGSAKGTVNQLGRGRRHPWAQPR